MPTVLTHHVALLTMTLTTLTGYCAWAQQDVQAPSIPPSESHSEEAYYTNTQPSRDGIGKVYMGREIAQVMGHLGAQWLDRPERQQEERTDLLITMLELEPNDVVADIGAGSGYFTIPLARQVTNGNVLAVEIQPEMLEILQKRAKEEQLNNIKPVLGTITDPKLPDDSVDLVLMVDAYHEFSHPREMMDAIVMGLKPGGRVVLVEFRAEDPKVMIKPLHKMSEEQARREMEAVGLKWVTTKSELPQQHVLIFAKPEPSPAVSEPTEKDTQ